MEFSRPHGTKRPPDNDLADDQPLAKKLGRLQLDPDSDPENARRRNSPQHPPAVGPSNDSMLLDDTKHTIYVHDLDREIADIESQEESVAFLPRIAENLTPIPQLILTPPKPQGNELVLYREPSALSVPEEQDSVRRAVMESRERARKGRDEIQDSRAQLPPALPREDAARNAGTNEPECQGNDDAMDVDEEL